MKDDTHELGQFKAQLVADMGIHATVPRKSIQIKKIVIVNDYPMTRRKIRLLIEQKTDLCVVGESSIGADAIEMIAGMNPDLVVIGVEAASNINGIGFIKSLKDRFPSVKVLVLAMFDESLFAERALRVGAHGYMILKETASSSKKIMKAIGTVLNNELFVSEDISKTLISRLIRGSVDTMDISLEDLSSREIEIFLLVGRGFTTKEIANMLKLSIFTVETYKKNIRKKLKITNSPQMLKTAIQWMLMNNTR